MDRILGHSGPDDKVGGQTFSIVQLKYFAGNILKRFLKMLLAKKMSNTSYFGTSLHREKKQYLNTVNTQRWHVQQTKQSPCHQTMVML